MALASNILASGIKFTYYSNIEVLILTDVALNTALRQDFTSVLY